MNILYKDKDWLKQKYINEELSTVKIGKICRITNNSIRYWLKKNNIAVYSRNQAKHLRSLRQANHCNLSQEAIEWITGELLGDGHLASYSDYSAQFIYGSKHLEYINYVSNILNFFGIKQCGKIFIQYYKERKKINCHSYHYISLRYAELLPIRLEWYPNRKKIVPKDLKLTPLICRQWYIGDGYLGHTSAGNSYIRLCTQGFSIPGVKQLTVQLNILGFKVVRQPSSNELRIPTASTKDFLDYIGSCPVDCYQYKWEFRYKEKKGENKNVN